MHIGRAHVWTPVTTNYLVFRLLEGSIQHKDTYVFTTHLVYSDCELKHRLYMKSNKLENFRITKQFWWFRSLLFH
jgi:hypothetical protein